MEEVRVGGSRVFIWPGIHAEVGENVRVLAPGSRQVFIFTDRKCIPIAKRVALSLIQANFELGGYAMYPGESRKTLHTALGVYGKMIRTRMERGCAFVTVGGGVVAELGGFVASTYRDGLRLFHVPTTLVAQVDAGIAGRAGVNLKGGRNYLTHPCPASAVFVDPTLLETLPPREYRAGLAEVVKHGMVREADLLACLEENIEELRARQPLLLEELAFRCASIRAAVEKEAQASGVRAVLHYGHTVGRALEAAGGFRKIHPGEALSVGMEAEACIAEALGVAPPGVRKAQNRILRLLDLPTRARGVSPEKLIEGMEFESRSAAGRPRLALPEAVGRASHGVEIPPDVLAEALRAVLLPGRRIRAVRPMAFSETEETPAAPVPVSAPAPPAAAPP
jgi:3-dehydroquinate synthase